MCIHILPPKKRQQSRNSLKMHFILLLIYPGQINLRPSPKRKHRATQAREKNVLPEGSVIHLLSSQLSKALSRDESNIKSARGGLLVSLHKSAGSFCQIPELSDSSIPPNTSFRSMRWTETGNSVYFGKVSVTCLVYISRLNPGEAAELLVTKENN